MSVFKGLYRGQGIYWSGSYNLDGSGDFDTIEEARAFVDRSIEIQEQREMEEKRAKIASGAIAATRNGDLVTVNFPDGARTVTIRQYRQNVFEWEKKYGREIVWS